MDGTQIACCGSLGLGMSLLAIMFITDLLHEPIASYIYALAEKIQMQTELLRKKIKHDE